MSTAYSIGPDRQPSTVGGITPTGQQAAAVDAVIQWYRDPMAPQTFNLFGYAGTGKTTLAQRIVNALNLSHVEYAAFTGKAAHVLQTKGCTGARTIHSLIYMPKPQLRDELVRLRRALAELDPEAPDYERAKAELEREIEKLERELDTPMFTLRDRDECDLSDADLLILDEASMVDRQIGDDLESFYTKILVLGDPAQLPPIHGEGYFTGQPADYLLTEIHRSALDSPVTRIATAVRNSPDGDVFLGCHGIDGASGRLSGPVSALEYDQVLCWRNDTRWRIIRKIRAQLKRNPVVPETGDRVMALANNPTVDVFNGQQFTVLDCLVDPDYKNILILEVLTDEGERRVMYAWADGFIDKEHERRAKNNGRDGKVAAITFAQCITVHKSQGSQWDHVLVVDETRGLIGMEFNKRVSHARNPVDRFTANSEAYRTGRRWLYTAVTRAAKSVAIVNEGQVA